MAEQMAMMQSRRVLDVCLVAGKNRSASSASRISAVPIPAQHRINRRFSFIACSSSPITITSIIICPGHTDTRGIKIATIAFFHPDCTVGIGISPIQPELADYHRRSGIAPCPEDLYELMSRIPQFCGGVKIKVRRGRLRRRSAPGSAYCQSAVPVIKYSYPVVEGTV